MPLTSFYSALTGLNNNTYSLNLIGDNLANMNTVAFKTSTAMFSELLAGLSGTGDTGNPVVLGLGSTLNGIQRNNNQGTITSTGKATDVAINGNGFFIVEAGSGNGYTRAGNFQIDKGGNLVSADGFNVLGYMATNGVINGGTTLTPITINIGDMIPAKITSGFTIKANLDCRAAAGDTFSAPITVYDSLGAAHTLSITFTKGAGGWAWDATIPGAEVGATGPTSVGSGSITFDSDGRLDPVATVNPTLNITGLVDGAANLTVTFNMLDADGNSNVTGQASESSVSKTIQDGYASSILASMTINSAGVIQGTTAGGQSVVLAQLALANFPNVDGLQKYKGNTFIPFASSGEPSIGMAGTGGRGMIAGSSLEQSNVDMALEFVNLITAQRAYQANSRVITTSDELYQDSLNMKR
jgi:flagellar hook protein FlgE